MLMYVLRITYIFQLNLMVIEKKVMDAREHTKAKCVLTTATFLTCHSLNKISPC